ncbi:hypothetical protein LG3211_5327 [Lysobacter gummosus]|nr:hypothetical protein LG3211_5327 [Lysobacter gummosus]
MNKAVDAKTYRRGAISPGGMSACSTRLRIQLNFDPGAPSHRCCCSPL